ncbi:hypothetical protein BWP39_13435 [Paraburkholderia acidicola]|uniref:Uncharacterized protein n=1 Tax=Paraburkholderia acidicola TaxID=1912599 RepID=A0A2A4EXD6_9BURK|nr:hypothetical protein BWP39_13435 [Paraburkholderia acidicola]
MASQEKTARHTTLRSAIGQSVRYAIAACAVGLLLSGCATGTTHSSNECVGPPDFCTPYFGS